MATKTNTETRTRRQHDPKFDQKCLDMRVKKQMTFPNIAKALGLAYPAMAYQAAQRANGGEKPPALDKKETPAKKPAAKPAAKAAKPSTAKAGNGKAATASPKASAAA